MTYLLDTNACIALINGRPEAVRRRFARVSSGDDVIATSSVVLFELWYGVAKSQHTKANADRIATFLSGPLEVMDFTPEDAEHLAGFAQLLKDSVNPSVRITFLSPARLFATRRHWSPQTRQSLQEFEVFGCRTGPRRAGKPRRQLAVTTALSESMLASTTTERVVSRLDSRPQVISDQRRVAHVQMALEQS